MFYKINCYINYIHKDIINVSICDDTELDKFYNMLIKLNKNNNIIKKNNFNLKLLSKTVFKLNTNYNDIHELRGINVTINGYSKYYCFSVDCDKFDENTNLFYKTKKIIKGNNLYVSKITNL